MDKVGNILPNGVVERDYFGQGMIFKDPTAFKNKSDAVCYIPELSDSRYTYKDFLGIASGNEKLAELLFDSVNWQHPETLWEEMRMEMEEIEIN